MGSLDSARRQGCAIESRGSSARKRFMRSLVLHVGLVLGCAVAGCDRADAVRHYRVPKVSELESSQTESPPASARPADARQPAASPDQAHQALAQPADQRMLAAVILHGDQAWFFKAVGLTAQLDSQADAFRALIKSVRFVNDKPQWSLPQDWRQRGESGMRFATLEFGPADETVELTVIPLPIPAGDRDAYVLSNVNRWRQQLALGPLSAAELSQQAEQSEVDGAKTILVDLRGK